MQIIFLVLLFVTQFTVWRPTLYFADNRMLQTGEIHKESLPDNESFDLVIEMLLSRNQIDSALKYVDLTLKSGYTLSMKAFVDCVQRCVNNGRLDTLVSIIERCKVHTFSGYSIWCRALSRTSATDSCFMDDIRKWIKTNPYVLLGVYAIILLISQCNQITVS